MACPQPLPRARLRRALVACLCALALARAASAETITDGEIVVVMEKSRAFIMEESDIACELLEPNGVRANFTYKPPDIGAASSVTRGLDASHFAMNGATCSLRGEPADVKFSQSYPAESAAVGSTEHDLKFYRDLLVGGTPADLAWAFYGNVARGGKPARTECNVAGWTGGPWLSRVMFFSFSDSHSERLPHSNDDIVFVKDKMYAFVEVSDDTNDASGTADSLVCTFVEAPVLVEDDVTSQKQPEKAPTSRSSLSGKAVAGIVVGLCVALCLIAGLITYGHMRRARRDRPVSAEPEAVETSESQSVDQHSEITG